MQAIDMIISRMGAHKVTAAMVAGSFVRETKKVLYVRQYTIWSA